MTNHEHRDAAAQANLEELGGDAELYENQEPSRFSYAPKDLHTISAGQVDRISDMIRDAEQAGATPEELQQLADEELQKLEFDPAGAQNGVLVGEFVGVDGKRQIRAFGTGYEDFGVHIRNAELVSSEPLESVTIESDGEASRAQQVAEAWASIDDAYRGETSRPESGESATELPSDNLAPEEGVVTAEEERSDQTERLAEDVLRDCAPHIARMALLARNIDPKSSNTAMSRYESSVKRINYLTDQFRGYSENDSGDERSISNLYRDLEEAIGMATSDLSAAGGMLYKFSNKVEGPIVAIEGILESGADSNTQNANEVADRVVKYTHGIHSDVNIALEKTQIERNLWNQVFTLVDGYKRRTISHRGFQEKIAPLMQNITRGVPTLSEAMSQVVGGSMSLKEYADSHA